MELQLELALPSSNRYDQNQDCDRRRKRSFDEAILGINRNIDNVEVVGWPPVKFCHRNRRRCTINYVNVENGGGAVGRRSNYMYVKVKMEGVGIARKVDLSGYHSYQTLTANLMALFGKYLEETEMYNLTYQDKEGDWLLAGDVPWESFIQSVRRLKLQRNGY